MIIIAPKTLTTVLHFKWVILRVGINTSGPPSILVIVVSSILRISLGETKEAKHSDSLFVGV
jgi:hypothetical protein